MLRLRDCQVSYLVLEGPTKTVPFGSGSGFFCVENMVTAYRKGISLIRRIRLAVEGLEEVSKIVHKGSIEPLDLYR